MDGRWLRPFGHATRGRSARLGWGGVGGASPSRIVGAGYVMAAETGAGGSGDGNRLGGLAR